MQKICMSIDQPESSQVNWLTKYNVYVLFVLIKYDEKKFPVLRVLDLKVEIVKKINSNRNYVNEKYKEIKFCSGYRKGENSTKNTFRHT